MKVIVIGARGIPDYLGGVETHCQELYPRLVLLGCEVIVVRRSAYASDELSHGSKYMGVKLVDIYSPKIKSFEAIVHTFLAVLYARGQAVDIVHIHAIGPSLLTPLVRLLGMNVVSTNHGPDYDRHKWGWVAKKMLHAGEKFGALFSNKVIAISEVIQGILKREYDVNADVIFNGVAHKKAVAPGAYLKTLGIRADTYVVAVGRFVEEKALHDLIDAFSMLGLLETKLVLVGDSDHQDEYCRMLKQKAKDAGVVLTGFISGDRLVEVFANAQLFVLPSYHEGLPIALLEALGFSLPVLISDIDANKAIGLPESDYFIKGNVPDLKEAIERKLAIDKKPNYQQYLDKYDWDRIAMQTYELYQRV